MTDVDIREIDPTDETQLRPWWEVGSLASAERPFDAWPAWEVSRVALPKPGPGVLLTLLAATTGEEAADPLGTALIVWFLLDNTHLAEVNVYVAPERRRQGVGTALLAEAERRVRDAGRTTVLSSTYAPVGAESPGSGFAAARGYLVASAEESKLVDLPTSVASWDGLEAEAEAARGDYRVVSFEDRTPEEYVPEFCSLLSTFIEHIPMGDLDLENARWTPERLRENEHRTIEIGRTWVVALAIASDGRLCGFSDLRIASQDPGHASVGGTLVLPEHRGHRLGLAMKLRTHRRLLELFPTCAYVETGNAGVNVMMNAVNERMGYRVVERCLDVQKLL